MRRILSLLSILSLSFPQSAHALRALEVTESGAEETVARTLAAGLEEKDKGASGREITGGNAFMKKRGEPRWGLSNPAWEALWYLFQGRVPNSLDDALDELNARVRFRLDGQDSWGPDSEELAQKLIHALHNRIRNQYELDWDQWDFFFTLTNGNIPADSQRLQVILSWMIAKGTRAFSDTPLSAIEHHIILLFRERIRRVDYDRDRDRYYREMRQLAYLVLGVTITAITAAALGAVHWAWDRAGAGRPGDAPAPAVARMEPRRMVPLEVFRFKWQGEGPIAERDGERIDFNDWDELAKALTPEQVELFLRKQEGAESWLVPADSALPVNRAIHVFDQVGIPARQLPRDLNYFDLSQESAAGVTPDLLEGGIQDGDVVILRADQVTPEGAKGLIPEGVKARVVLLTPLMLKQITARQLLFVAGRLDPGETLWIQHLSSVTFEGQRYLMIAA